MRKGPKSKQWWAAVSANAAVIGARSFLRKSSQAASSAARGCQASSAEMQRGKCCKTRCNAARVRKIVTSEDPQSPILAWESTHAESQFLRRLHPEKKERNALFLRKRW
jgi:hypothetical protein